MESSGSVKYKKSEIHYLRFGHGEKFLLAFHGFSENAGSFLVLEPSLGKKYTIIAIDIPYHGKTIWNETSHFTTADLIAIVRQFIMENSVSRFSLLGFSMGGKCALYVAEEFTEHIDELFLLACDGIKTNRIYNVAVYPAWGRVLFKTTIKHPAWLFTVIYVANKMHLLSPWLKKFTQAHMETREKRQRLYDTWISMREFNPDVQNVKTRLNQYQTRVFLFFGVRDEVIPLAVGEYFATALNNCVFIRLERGHYFIDDRLNPFITEALHQ